MKSKKKSNAKKGIVAGLLALCLATGGVVAYHKTTMSASSNGRYIYSLLTKKYGFNGAQAAGIAANIYYESGYNPNAGGSCYGLVQWTGARKSSMRRYASSLGYRSSSIKGQVAYLVHELKTSERAAYSRIKATGNSASGAFRSGYAFCYYFERPANKVARSNQRGNYARRLYHSFGGAKAKGKTSHKRTVRRRRVSSRKHFKTGTYKTELTMTLRKGPSVNAGVKGIVRKGTKVKVKTIKNKKWAAYKGGYFSLKYSRRVK